MKIHRAITLVVLILMSLALVFYSVRYAFANFTAQSLIPLGVVLVAAAAAGAAFSWRRYFPRRR